MIQHLPLVSEQIFGPVDQVGQEGGEASPRCSPDFTATTSVVQDVVKLESPFGLNDAHPSVELALQDREVLIRQVQGEPLGVRGTGSIVAGCFRFVARLGVEAGQG